MSRVLPILFNTDMVLAILDDRKTATRRLVKGDIVLRPDMEHKVTFLPYKPRKDRGCDIKTIKYFTLESLVEHEAPYQPGDILYVRETWSTQKSNECMGNTTAGCPYNSCDTATGSCFEDEYIYKATDRLDSSVRKWHPSIHMPKEAARIWLRVTDVRVERLRSMVLDDFLAEGVTIRPEAFNDPENAYWQAREQFKTIWDSTVESAEIDKYGCEASPWVWVIEFERCDKPESEG